MANLTDKQQAFINEYLKCWNATEAARRAGYSYKTASVIGYENLRKPQIADEVRRRIDEETMSADEAMHRLSRHARASFADVLRDNIDVPMVNWRDILETGAIDIIKEINIGKDSITVKLHDAQSALKEIIKQRQLLEGKPTERSEVITNDSRERLAHLISRHAERQPTPSDN